MRTIFKNHRQVCEAWAKQEQPRGRAGNIEFRGDTIYSYGWWPMARIDGSVALIRDETYSMSTSKHQAYVRSALWQHGYTRFHVLDLILQYIVFPYRNHQTNIDHYQAKLRKLADQWHNAREYKQGYVNQYKAIADEARAYAEHYHVTDLLPPLFGLELARYF
jgi:hypothetical protein